MQVMPLCAKDRCALAASGGCFANSMAAGVWQLRHSAESFAFQLLPDFLREFQPMCFVLRGRVHFKAADKAARKRDTDNEGDQPSGRYTEQEPALRTPLQPCCKPLAQAPVNSLRSSRCSHEQPFAQ
jgi:hypothetical protein